MENTDQEETNLGYQEEFEKLLEEPNLKNRVWRDHEILGKVLHSKKEEFLKTMGIDPVQMIYDPQTELKKYDEVIAQQTQDGVAEDTILIQKNDNKRKIFSAVMIIEYYKSLKFIEKFKSYSKSSFIKDVDRVAAQQKLKENLDNLKAGAGMLTKYVKPVSELTNHFLVYEETQKVVDPKQPRRRKFQYLVWHDLTTQNKGKISKKVEVYRNGKYFEIPREQLKSSFTYQIKIATEKGMKGFEVEIDLRSSIFQIFEVMRKTLRKKFAFASLVYIYQQKYEVVLVKESWLKKYKAEVHPDQKKFNFDFNPSEPPNSLNCFEIVDTKLRVHGNMVNSEEETEDLNQFYIKDEQNKRIYLVARAKLRNQFEVAHFFEHFMNQTITALVTRPNQLKMIQTFRTLSKIPQSQPTEKMTDTFSSSNNLRIHGIAVFTRKYTAFQDKPVTLVVNIKSKSDNLSTTGKLKMTGNQPSGLKKIWLNRSFEVKQSGFIDISMQVESSSVTNSLRESVPLESDIVRWVKNDMNLVRKDVNMINSLELQFTQKDNKFVCAVYYTLA